MKLKGRTRMSSSDISKQGSKGKPFRRYGRKPEEERKGRTSFSFHT
jgi:hypothetical protein